MPRGLDPTGGPHGQSPSDARRLADFLSSRELSSGYVQNNLSFNRFDAGTFAELVASDEALSSIARAAGAGGGEPSPEVPPTFAALLFDLFLMYFKFVPEFVGDGGDGPRLPQSQQADPRAPPGRGGDHARPPRHRNRRDRERSGHRRGRQEAPGRAPQASLSRRVDAPASRTGPAGSHPARVLSRSGRDRKPDFRRRPRSGGRPRNGGEGRSGRGLHGGRPSRGRARLVGAEARGPLARAPGREAGPRPGAEDQAPEGPGGPPRSHEEPEDLPEAQEGPREPRRDPRGGNLRRDLARPAGGARLRVRHARPAPRDGLFSQALGALRPVVLPEDRRTGRPRPRGRPDRLLVFYERRADGLGLGGRAHPRPGRHPPGVRPNGREARHGGLLQHPNRPRGRHRGGRERPEEVPLRSHRRRGRRDGLRPPALPRPRSPGGKVHPEGRRQSGRVPGRRHPPRHGRPVRARRGLRPRVRAAQGGLGLRAGVRPRRRARHRAGSLEPHADRLVAAADLARASGGRDAAARVFDAL